MNPLKRIQLLSVLVLSLLGGVYAIDVVKGQYDLGCTNANTAEAILTPANVNTTTFGKLFSKSVDGQVYAQPLFLENLSIGGGVHNVVFVCTQNNSVYAFDADNGSAAAYWHRSLPAAQSLSCVNIQPVVGITATPGYQPGRECALCPGIDLRGRRVLPEALRAQPDDRQ